MAEPRLCTVVRRALQDAGHRQGHRKRDVPLQIPEQKALIEARAGLEQLMAGSPTVICCIEPTQDYRFTFISENTRRQLGYEPQQFLDVAAFWREHIHAEDRARVLADLERLAEHRRCVHEYRFQAGDGTHRWMRAEWMRLDGSDGEAAEIIGYWTDITDFKRKERALRLTERHLATVLETSSDAIISVDEDQHIRHFNRGAAVIFGYTAEEVAGQPLDVLLPEHVREAYRQYIRSFAAEPGSMRMMADRAEITGRRKDGSEFPARASISKINTADGILFNVILRDVTERKHFEFQLTYLATHDDLTGLPNRNLLQDRLEQSLVHARRSGRMVAVLFFDIDRFKTINDSLGHDAGDQLLCRVAKRLLGCVRESDTVARLGGDEFVIVLADLTRRSDVTLVARKIHDALIQPMVISEQELFVTGSIGISLYPNDGKDLQALLMNADSAMYRAKDQGRNNFQFYTQKMNARALDRLMLESGLRHALVRNEFLLHYQPLVNLHSGNIIGLEALLRWERPGQGLIQPADFIPLAEETGLVVSIGEWVLRTACKQVALWNKTFDADLRIAVNLSAQQFEQRNVVETISRVLRDTGLKPDCLELELTERIVMQNASDSIATLQQLSAMGTKLAIDDFGTGYSCLNYLKRLPIDTIKIDQSFVRDITTDPDVAAIARSIITLSHSMKLDVIAEGVETESQLGFLRNNRCDHMQGYYFSKPLPADKLSRLLEQDRRLTMGMGDSRKQRTLLIVDDDAGVRSSLARALGRQGYRILMADSARAAFDLLANNQVGVVISDQRMQPMTGVEFLSRVKDIHPKTVRIILTGYSDLETALNAINRGEIYKFLTKPWDNDLLRRNISEAFQCYELASENMRLAEELKNTNDLLEEANNKLLAGRV